MTQETYQHPHVPAGYKHIRGEWDSGFVIRYIKNEFESESEFVWIPVGALRADGTQDGVHLRQAVRHAEGAQVQRRAFAEGAGGAGRADGEHRKIRRLLHEPLSGLSGRRRGALQRGEASPCYHEPPLRGKDGPTL